METQAMSWLVSAVLLTLSAAILLLRRHSSRLHQLAAKMPGPPTVPLLGNALLFACNGEELMPMLRGILRQYGDVVKLWMGPDLNVLVGNPDDVKLLLASSKNSVRGPFFKYMVEQIGGGLVSGSGPAWRRHRKIANPNFGKRAIEGYEEVFLKESSFLQDRLRRETGRELDVFDQIVKSTTYAVCQTLMALSKEETMNLPHLHELICLTDRFYECLYYRMTKWWNQFNIYYRFTGTYAFSKKFRNMYRELCASIVEHRSRALADMDLSKSNLETDEDSSKNTELGVVDRFILSKELDSNELLEETFSIFTATQEASAKIISFMLLMMAYHPECQERLYSEIVSVTGAGGAGATLAPPDLQRMPYLDCVLKECLRLFTTGPLLQRTVTEEVKISTHTLPAGCAILVPLYELGRDSRYWDHPDEFYPDHFLSKSVAARPAGSYLPFSIGPMDCIGRHYGIKLIKLLFLGAVREFRLTSNQTYKGLRLKFAISMSPVDGFKVILHPRN